MTAEARSTDAGLALASEVGPSPGFSRARELVRGALEEAAFAPSAHNTQPARWAVSPDGRVILLEDRDRQLTASDPTGRDHLLSLGAAWEGMSLALTRSGWRLGEPAPTDAGGDRHEKDSLRPVAMSSLVPCSEPDELVDAVRERRTYRAPFPPASPAERDRLSVLLQRYDAARAVDRALLPTVAALYDETLLESLSDAPVLDELRRWMRLSSRDASSAVDGLTAATLGLSPALAAAGHLLRPRPFALLKRAGLARALVSEARAVESATAVVVLQAARTTWMLSCGRELYRFWLDLTAAGFSACPMSALLDVSAGESAMARLVGLPDDRVPFAVLRVGPAPTTPPARSPRLPHARLLVERGSGS